MDQDLRVTLLDGFTVRAGGLPAAGDLPPAAQRLVALLCLTGGPARADVSGRLWPGAAEERARARLRSVLWRLRRCAPGLVLDTAPGTLRLAAGVRVDVRELQAWAGQVGDPRVAARRLALPRPALLGDLLPGWYDDWVLRERDRLDRLRSQALETAAVRLSAAGRYAEALEAAHLVIRAEPLRESAHRAVVRVHLAEGNVAEALRAHDLYRDLLREELGVPPTGRMTRLVQGLGRAGRLAS
ncbi:AfsR/SARP family transcriptional regulator [Geodermatophilus sp. SYSU D00700]